MLWYLAVHRVSHSMGTFGTRLRLLGLTWKTRDNGLDCTNRIADICNGIEIVHHQAKPVGCAVDESRFGILLIDLSLYSANFTSRDLASIVSLAK